MAAARLEPLEIMRKLVGFPTVSRDSNLPLVDWVEEYLGSHGIVSHRHYDDTGTKASLFAHVGPGEEGGVVLSGHTDVVPVDGQAWDTDPWEVVERDGRYHGRGTCDMKGFDALAIWAMVEAGRGGLARPLQLALSYDEEVGCLGAPPMIERMGEVLPRASAVIVGEPSMMAPVTAHKGGLVLMTRVEGFEVHSSLLPDGVSAIMNAAKLIEWANRTNAESAAGKPDAMAGLFHPSYTTVHVGRIKGGTAGNITAKECSFSMDMRILPGEDVDDWRARYRAEADKVAAGMRETHPGAGIAIEEIGFVPGLKPEKDGEAERIVRRITGDNGEHAVSYGTEAGQFQERGYSAVICGPGDIAQAHQPNEYISASQLEAGAGFLSKLVGSMRAA